MRCRVPSRKQLIRRLAASTVTGALCASPLAIAESPLGIYVGAGVGESDVRTDNDASGSEFRFDGHHSAWKAIVGVRPISPLGVEGEYIDFGNPSTSRSNAFVDGFMAADAKATAVFGLGYLPLPVPFLDFYGKAGVARLHSTSEEAGPAPFCPASFVGPCLPGTLKQSAWSTNFAYGAGAQGEVGALAVRAEYERINASGGNPDIFSVSVTWTS
jgi:opacity protein-like surface antigen